MLKDFRLLLIISMVALGSMACEFSALTSAIQNTPVSGEVLFQDDFSNPNSGWTTWKQEVSEVSYEAGGLRMVINEPHYDYWARPGRRFTDSRAEVDITKVSGPDNNDFGLICRYRNGDNFYGFFASSDGYYGIARVKDGQYKVLGPGELRYSDKIRKGSALNRMRADCVGNTFTLYVNNQSLVQVQDDSFQSGEVGVLAGAYDRAGVEILFDNFIVLKP